MSGSCVGLRPRGIPMLIDGSDHHLLVRMLIEFLKYLAVGDLWI
jgi:hypothetical protein